MLFKETLQRWCWPLMPGWPDEGRRIVQDKHLRALIERARQQSPRFPLVFNAGSGEGGYSPLLLGLPGVETVVESDFGWHLKGPDPRQFFFRGSITSIPVSDDKFDLILCTEVLEHILDHEQALDELARVLQPGGWLLITVPTPPAVPDTAHVREGYRPRELSDLLTPRGFHVVETRFCMHFFFRLVLKHWARPPWCPRIIIRTLSRLDVLLPIGEPMDLMVLARLLAKTESASPTPSRK
jgi:SAM-dependent methyltransferase